MAENSVDKILSQSVPNPEPVESVAPEPQEVAEEPVAESEAPEVDAEPEAVDDSSDEYGETVAKDEPKFTNADVQRIVQERLARALKNKPHQEPEQEPEQKPRYEEPEESDWERELESLVDRRLEMIEQRKLEAQWKEQAAQEQNTFEQKFSTSMSKYNDFEETVAPLAGHLNPTMAQALKGMDNPAAFIYNAAKKHKDEIIRISSMNNPYQQVIALGALEASMKKKKIASSAPAPVNRDKGDYSPAQSAKVKNSIDHAIAQEENRKRERFQR